MERPLKVLHVVPSVGPWRGGPSVMINTLTRGLAKHGLDVHVATTDDNGPSRLTVPQGVPLTEDGVTYHYFPRQMRLYTFSWPLSRWLARSVRVYDLIHIHALFSHATGAAAFWARRNDVPYVVRPLGTLNRWGMQHRRRILKHLSFRLLERRILSGAALIHYTSEQEQMEAAELGVRSPWAIVPNAVDFAGIPASVSAGQFRARHPRLAGRTILLFLSRLDHKKGLDLLLPAFAQLHRRAPQTTLVLGGSGEPAFIAGLRDQAMRLGIGGDVLWAGFLTGAHKWAALTDADVFVLPSYSENFGIALVEAMACGVPVVTSDQVGIHREITGAQAGLVVPCDVAALSRALAHLVDDASLRAQMAHNGRAIAQANFSLEAVASRLAAIYHEIHRSAAASGESAASGVRDWRGLRQ